MEISQKKMQIDFSIRSVKVNLFEEPVDVFIKWQRGDKQIETKSASLDPSSGIAPLRERFQMTTALEFDNNK